MFQKQSIKKTLFSNTLDLNTFSSEAGVGYNSGHLYEYLKKFTIAVTNKTNNIRLVKIYFTTLKMYSLMYLFLWRNQLPT